MPRTTITPARAGAVNEACIADKLRLLNRVVTNIYDEQLRGLGITAAQMTVLVVVAKYGTASPGQVAGWLHLEKSTLSRNIDRLKKQGWLRSSRPGSGRGIELELTAKGERVLNEGLPRWKRAQRQAESILGDAGIKEIRAVAERLRS